MSPADILKKAIDAANIPTDSEPEHDSPERKGMFNRLAYYIFCSNYIIHFYDYDC